MWTGIVKASCAGCVVLGVVCLAGASPVKAPKRVVGQQTVDLTPLLHWWTNHVGSRPLTAWVHVTGTIVGTNAYGWVVEAQVEPHRRAGQDDPVEAAGGAKRILLRHPPLQDRAAFEALSAQLKALEQERNQAAGQEAQARNYLHPSNGVHYAHFKGEGFARSEAGAVEHAAASSKQGLDKRIKDLKTRMASWPRTDHYELDCFALDTGTESDREPVYDHGMSWP